MAATYSSLVGLAVGGKYEIRRVLGIGGMGVVCEAIHMDLGKKVAIKLIDKTMKESELIVARFRREARALGQIHSEHIVDVFDVGADQRVGLYMVMEYLAGEDLQSRLERDKRLDLVSGVMMAHQMARGLEKAHAAGVIHRDLKPANVFLTTRDNGSLLVKLLDFGVSKVLNEVGGARITGSGAPIGTPLYMSPEQAEGKDDTDGRADIWSLGAVLYEALAGAPPFADRGSYHGTIVGILTSRPQLLHDAAPWVPAELAKVIDAMLVHDRSARIKDASTVSRRILEAYPQVMADGTGRHTAVIVNTPHAVDAVGDTEIFTSQGFLAAQNAHPQGRSGVDDSDSKRTVPNAGSDPAIPGFSNDALRTAAATPIEMGRGDASGAGVARRDGSVARRTDPLPWPHGASSSASGVAMPGTPPVMDPLLGRHDVAPDTMRDARLAVRAERRRWGTLVAIFGIIGACAVGGFVLGKRESRDRTSKAASASSANGAAEMVAGSPPSAAPSAGLGPTAALTSPGTAASSGPAPASSTGGASVAASSVSSSAPASAAPSAPPVKRRKRPVSAPPASSAEPKPAEEAPSPMAPNPFTE
ncbi:MAG: hypothetical protein JWP97_45 [Labilithrix sp.]|nr:hypothetical protein [Labilithrix sp.]